MLQSIASNGIVALSQCVIYLLPFRLSVLFFVKRFTRLNVNDSQYCLSKERTLLRYVNCLASSTFRQEKVGKRLM